MSVPHSSDDTQRRARLLLLLLARAADLPVDEIDGPDARALAASALPRTGHRTATAGPRTRPWMCSYRRTA